MIRDKVVFGGFIGALGKIVMGIFEIPLWRLGIIKHPLAHYAASLFVGPTYLHRTLSGQIIGLVADFSYGMFWGVVFVYLIYFTGKRHFIIKGLMFGAFLWLFSFGVLRSLAMVKLREVESQNGLYYLFFHILFGLALGLIFKKLNERKLVE